MFRLGLTGSIATGKSTVLKMFEALGAKSYDADDVVHALYQNEAVAPLQRVFPDAIVDQTVDRKALSQILAKNPERLAELETIVHPLVRAKMNEFTQNMQEQDISLAVYDIPLLFEAGHHQNLDAVAVTYCEEPELRRRAMLRPGMTHEKLNTILKRQMSQDEKLQLAKFSIFTNQPFEHVQQDVAQIFAQCTQ